MIPETSVPDFRLSIEVVDAVQEERFHVRAVRTIGEGTAFLTGSAAGARRSDGTYFEGTVRRRAYDRITTYAEALTTFDETTEATRGARAHV